MPSDTFDKELMLRILGNTPERVKCVIQPLEDEDIKFKPHADHFSIKDILGHFIHGEDDDWIPRLKLILRAAERDDDPPTFTPFDRFAQEKFIQKYTTQELLRLFQKKREKNLQFIRDLAIDQNLLELKGIHPALGEVNVEWLLNTWLAHDLSHINQINRILVAKFSNVGPWKEYLRILQ